jgi:hypothetical protein
MSLLPKEHGAYGQIAFPLVTAFGVAGISTAGLLLTACVVASFLSHEAAAVLLGLRGPRARRCLGRRALRWFGCCLVVGTAAGVGALLTIDAAVRWSIAVPLAPALLLAIATARGHEKSWHGEVSAALAFSGAAVPVSLAAAAPLKTGLAVAIPFALLFVASTLAVRVVILRVRGGGDHRSMRATRRSALAVAGSGLAVLGVAVTAGALSPFVLVAAAPGLLTAAVIAARPPAPAHLRPLGWTLVAVSVVTATIVVVAV